MNNSTNSRITLLTLCILSCFPRDAKYASQLVRCKVSDDDLDRSLVSKDLFRKAFNACDTPTCETEFLAGDMILSCVDTPDLFDHPGDRLMGALLHCENQLTLNSQKDEPLSPERAVDAPAIMELLKFFALLPAAAAAGVRIHTAEGHHAAPIVPVGLFAEPATKETKKRRGPFTIMGLESVAWDGNRALYVTDSRVRVVVPNDMPGFGLDRLVETLSSQTYLHGTIVKSDNSKTWTIQPGAFISTQRSIDFGTDD